MSCSKYSSFSHVFVNASLEITGWQRIIYGEPSPKHEQGRFMGTIGLQPEWGWVLGSERCLGMAASLRDSLEHGICRCSI